MIKTYDNDIVVCQKWAEVEAISDPAIRKIGLKSDLDCRVAGQNELA